MPEIKHVLTGISKENYFRLAQGEQADFAFFLWPVKYG